MKIIYEIDTGRILSSVADLQTIEGIYFHYPQSFKDNLDFIETEEHILDLRSYRVADNILVKIPDDEILDIQMYGRVLSEEERFLLLLKPSYEETQKAEHTIEILTILQEVM